jgi:hypothetical protein
MSGQLFLSFWHVCLDNLPEGTFSHRRITREEARALLEHTRQGGGRVVCVSNDDLLAPYREKELRSHKELCGVLREHFRIPLSIRDFLVSEEHEGQALYSVIPLQGAQIQEQDRLLVVTCGYALPDRRAGTPVDFYIAPETTVLHLIEHTPPRKRQTLI